MKEEEKQKTPLQELIENLESNQNEYVSKEHYLRFIKVVLLPKEREVIEKKDAEITILKDLLKTNEDAFNRSQEKVARLQEIERSLKDAMIKGVELYANLKFDNDELTPFMKLHDENKKLTEQLKSAEEIIKEHLKGTK